MSRAAIFELGFPDPLLQTCHLNPRGGFYFTDFEWPAYRLIGEFDGKGKYVKDEYLRGLTPGEAVHREKVREDDLSRGRQWRGALGSVRSAPAPVAAAHPHDRGAPGPPLTGR
ncbi:hypothetical protein [Cryobacterium mannosilyticum]|uniref:Uncharacterized protein n=1 Tax=Cryobacterium mannosilyticum TaxID=1259190 RepID=A0A4R8W0K0_9MICO|nr:hypothetical protein [Cryobacterium mannosilyticum]TFB99968.1 hypothetical protein E3O32_16150 [Cryobacterium mannosilyticum]